MTLTTRSQAVARIADRTASQVTTVIIAIVLIGLAYYECISLIWKKLKQTTVPLVQYRLKIREGSRQVRSELPVWCFVISLRP